METLQSRALATTFTKTPLTNTLATSGLFIIQLLQEGYFSMAFCGSSGSTTLTMTLQAFCKPLVAQEGALTVQMTTQTNACLLAV